MKTTIAEILDGLDLPAEEKQQVALLLANEKVRQRIDGELKNVQSEFSRGLDDARVKVTQAEADKNAYYGQMNEWKDRQEQTVLSVQRQAQKDREAAAMMRARMESLNAAGLLDDDQLSGLPVTSVPPTGNGNGSGPSSVTAPDPNEGKFVTQQEGQLYLQLTPMLLDLQAEHMKITGQPLESTQELINDSLKAQGRKTIRQVWEEKYQIPKLREEQLQRAQAEHDEKIRREERTKVMSEITNPTSRPPSGAYQSPVLVAAQKTQQNTIPNVGSRRGVENAMAAHAAGKYEGGVVHTP